MHDIRSIPFFYDPHFFAINKPVPLTMNNFKDELVFKKRFKSMQKEFFFGEYLWQSLQKTRKYKTIT